jgi:uncharacterized membrane protein
LIEIGPYRLRSDASETELLVALKAAQDRSEQINKVDSEHPVKKSPRPEKFTFLDKLTLWYTRHYMAVINTIVGLFVGIPFLAPIFMEIRLPKPAQVIYVIYAPLYPITYEVLMGTDVIDGLEARRYIGDEIHGYKVAICERDVAMYASFFIFGVIFSIWKRHIKQIKWWLWILVGVVPIAIDGASQISGFGLQISWLPARESTPLLRTITGVLFGVFTAWYLLPMIDESVRATHRMLVRKQEILKQSGQ